MMWQNINVFDQEGVFFLKFVLSKNVTVEKNTYIFTSLTDPKNDLMTALKIFPRDSGNLCQISIWFLPINDVL